MCSDRENGVTVCLSTIWCLAEWSWQGWCWAKTGQASHGDQGGEDVRSRQKVVNKTQPGGRPLSGGDADATSGR